MTAPRWEALSDDERSIAFGVLTGARSRLVGGVYVAGIIDAALARLAGRSAEEERRDVVVYLGRVAVRLSPRWCAAEIERGAHVGAAHATPHVPAPAPTAAERWRAVPDGAKADARKIVEGEIAACQGDGACAECDALRALLALADEAGGGR